MKLSIPLALLAAALLPLAAHAETAAVRVGLEAPLYTRYKANGNSTSYSIGDSLQPAINLLLSYKPDPVLAFEVEFREGFAHTGDNYSRTGTAIGPGLRLSPAGLPLYVRASLPIHVEPSPVVVGLRAAGGLEIPLAVLSLYLEVAVDTSLVGGAVANNGGTSTGSSNVGPFDITTVSGGGGVWFKF